MVYWVTLVSNANNSHPLSLHFVSSSNPLRGARSYLATLLLQYNREDVD